MILLNPALAWFLPGMLMPLLLHLLWRRRVRLLLWGAMGPLRALRRQHARRLVFERWGLLSLRCFMLACLLLALCRPAWHDPEVDGRRRSGRTAAVLLIDDSASSRRGSERRAWDRMRALARTYIDGLQPGDEISVIRASRLATIAADPRFDHERVAAWLDSLQPSDVASDLPALVAAGIDQARRHINPSLELVLLTDRADDGWQPVDDPAWRPLWRRLQEGQARVLVLRGGAEPAGEAQHALVELHLAHDLVTVGETVAIDMRLRHWGALELPRSLQLQLLINDQPVAEQEVLVEQAGEQLVRFEHVFAQAGDYAIGGCLLDIADGDPADDRAWRSLSVIDSLPVLLLEGGQEVGRYLEAALAAPVDGRRAFTVETAHFSELEAELLRPVRVVALLDVPALQAEQVAMIEQFVVGGGGVLVSVGPESDPLLINRFWARGGDGFLPCPIGIREHWQQGRSILAADRSHPAIADLPDDATWSFACRGAVELEVSAVPSGDVQTILRLADGAPYCVSRRRGAGIVATWGGPLDRRWDDAVLAPVFAPLLRGLVHHLGSRLQPATTVVPGERLLLLGDEPEPPRLLAPDGRRLPLSAVRWRGRAAWRSPVLATAGVYRHDQRRLVCTVDPAERRPGDQAAFAAWRARSQARVFEQPAALAAAFDEDRPRIREWWPTLVGLAFAAALLEVLSLWYIGMRERRQEVG